MDEYAYKFRAEELFYGEDYLHAHYPLSYPLVICIAFLFKDFYFAMKVINILLSIIGTVGCYKIFRLFMPSVKSVICSLLMFLLPWQTNASAFIMSENLAYPLLVWIAYLLLYITENRHSWYYDIILGALICLLHLTRHMFIMLLPVFFVFWFLKKSGTGKWMIDFSRGNTVHAILIITTYLMIYVFAWIIPRIRMGDTLLFATGIQTFVVKMHSTLSKDENTGIDFKRLFTSVWAYLGYFSLALIYMMPPLVLGIFTKNGNKNPLIQRAIVLFVGISLICIVVAVRHSYLVAYNRPDFSHIMGRYILYSITLCTIMSLVLLDGYIGTILSTFRRRYLFLGIIILCACVWLFAEKTLIEGKLLGYRVSFLNTYGNEELMPYRQILIPVGGMFLLQIVIMLVIKSPGKTYFYSVVFSCCVVFLLINYLTGIVNPAVGERGILGRALFEYDESTGSLSDYSYIVDDVPGTSLAADLEFWETKDTGTVIGNDYQVYRIRKAGLLRSLNDEYYSNKRIIRSISVDDEILKSINVKELSGPGLLYTTSFETNGLNDSALFSVDYNSVQYSLYTLPLSREIEILESWPHAITADKKFNKQPSGLSALVVQTNLTSPGTYVAYVNGEAYSKIKISKDGRGAILIDDELYHTDGELHIEVHSNHYGLFYMREACNDYVIPIVEPE